MFSTKNAYKWAKYEFVTMWLSQKDSLWCENTDSPIKKKFWMQQSVKKVMLKIF